MKIAIIGSGNLGCAHAFKLAEFGHEISILKTSKHNDDNFVKIQEQGGIYGVDYTRNGFCSFQKIQTITRDVATALRDAQIVMVLTQTLYHQQIARMIVPFLPKSLLMLLIVPGSLGSLFFQSEIKRKDILIAEGESSLFDARISKNGEVEILFQNVRNALGFLPSKRKEEGAAIACKIYPTYVGTRSNVVESALHNPNLIVHTTGVIMSASRIEYSKGEFWLYKEAFTPATWNLINELDKEKNKVIKAFEGIPEDYLTVAEWRNSETLGNPMQSFINYSVLGSPKGTTNLKTRYIFEDVPNGLVLLISLAEFAGVDVPLARSLVHVANAIWNVDFFNKGRNLQSLGINNYEQLMVLL